MAIPALRRPARFPARTTLSRLIAALVILAQLLPAIPAAAAPLPEPLSAPQQQTTTGMAAGEVFDAATGLPLAGVTARLVTAAGESGVAVTSDANGRYRLEANPGPARIRLSKPGYTTVERSATLEAGKWTAPVDAYLTPLDPNAVTVISVVGGQINGVGRAGLTVLTVPPGALESDATLRVTPVEAAGLAGLLPLGWSPVAAADLAPAETSLSAPATLNVPIPAGLQIGATLVVARWDSGSGHWLAVSSAQVPPSGLVPVQVGALGQYVLALPDSAPANPSMPAAGAPLSGTVAGPLPTALTAAIDPTPRILLTGDDAESRVTVRVSSSQTIPSGTVFELESRETLEFLRGGRLAGAPLLRDLPVYAAAATNLTPAGALMVAPSRSIAPHDLRLGTIDLVVTLPTGRAGGTLVDRLGATPALGDIQLQIARNATQQPIPVRLGALDLAETASLLPAGIEALTGAAIDFYGAALSLPGTLSAPLPAGAQAGDQLLLLRLQAVGDETRIEMIAPATVQTGRMRAQGVLSEGRYLFARTTVPLGFVTGQVTDEAGRALAGAQVSLSTFPLVSLSSADGRYIVGGPQGAAEVVAVNVATRDTLKHAVTIGARGSMATLNLALAATGPVVVLTSPAANAVNVPITGTLSVVFSEPLDPASVGANALVVSDGATTAAGSLSLVPGGQSLSFAPSAFWASSATYTVTISGALQDLSGNAMGQPYVFRFDTVDITPPARPEPGQISATIPDQSGNSTVSGTFGTADPNGLVLVRNKRTAGLTTKQPNADGSFSMLVPALRSDKLELILRDAAGNETKMPLPRFANPDGSVVVGSEGGTVEGSGGVLAIIDPGSLPDGTVVKLDLIAKDDLPIPEPMALSSTMPYVGGLALSITDGTTRTVTPTTYIDLAVPAPADASPDDIVFVTKLVTVTQIVTGAGGITQSVETPVWAVIDRASLVETPQGKYYETASPPFEGMIGSGQVGMFKTSYIIAPGPDGELDSPTAVFSDDVYEDRPMGLGTYRVVAPGRDGILQSKDFLQGDDELRPECVSWVTVEAYFGFQVGIFSIGLPYFFPVTAGTATISGFCNQQMEIQVVAPDTGATILRATRTAPAGRNEIFYSPNVISNDSTPPTVVEFETPTRLFDESEDLRIRFSERMRQTTFPSLIVRDSDGNTVRGEAISTFGATGLAFRPDTPFRLEVDYTVAFSNVKDLAGNAVATPPLTFRRAAPTSLGQLGSNAEFFSALARCSPFPNEPCYVSGQDAVLIDNLLFIANGERFMYEYFLSEQQPSPLLTDGERARIAVIDVSDPVNPRLIGWHGAFTDPRALSIIRDAQFPYKDSSGADQQFEGDLLVVVGGGRAVRNINTASKLEFYDITACTAGPVLSGNCMAEPLYNAANNWQLTTLKGMKFLSTAPGGPLRPGVPPDFGVAMEVTTLHQQITVDGANGPQRKDTVAAYVAVMPIGIASVDLTKAFNANATAPATRFAPDGFYRGEYFDVQVLKNGLLAAESPSSGAERLRVFSASLFPLDQVQVPRAFRVSGGESLAYDIDGDGNLGLAEDMDDDDGDGRVDGADRPATSELFDLAFVSAGGRSTMGARGEVYIIDVSQLTDLEHDAALTDVSSSPDERIIARIPMPAPAFGTCVDADAKIAYVDLLDYGVALVDLKFLLGVITGRQNGNIWYDDNQDGVDDRIIYVMKSAANPAQGIKGSPCAAFKDGTIVMNWEYTGPEFFGSYTLSAQTPVRIKSDVDTINNQVCREQGYINISLTHDAKVTVTIDGAPLTVPGSAVGSNAPNVTLTTLPVEAGAYALPIPPDAAVDPGETPFVVKAIFAEGNQPVEQTQNGIIIHDVVNKEAFPIGHTMIEGVDLWDGHLTHGSQDLILPGRGPDLEFNRNYSSAGSDSDSPLGAGWSHNLDVKLIKDNCNRFVVVGGEGSGNAFSDAGQPDPARAALFASDLFTVEADALFHEPQLGYHSTLIRDPDNLDVFDFFTKSHVRYNFKREGQIPGEVYTLRFIEDPNGNRLTFDYTAIDANPATLDVVRDGGGRAIRLAYQTIYNRKRIVEVVAEVSQQQSELDLAPNITLKFGYDSVGNLVAVTRTTPYDGFGFNDQRVERYAYTAASPLDKHNLTGYTDPNGNATTYVYHDPGAAAGGDFPGYDPQFGVARHEFIKRIEKPEGVTLAFGYDLSINPAAPNKRTVSDPRPNVPATTYTLDSYGATTMVEGPLNQTTTYVWCTTLPLPAECGGRRDALKVAETDAMGRLTTYEYDAQGNIVRTITTWANADSSLRPVVDADGQAITRSERTATYDPIFNRVTSETDAEGNTTWYCLDSPAPEPANSPCDPTTGKTGNLLVQVDALGNATEYTYYPNGDMRTLRDARGYVTTFSTYDRFGNATRVEQPENAWSETIYDVRSRVRETTDSFGHHSRTTYDGLDRAIKEERLDDRGDGGPAQIEEMRYFAGGQIRRASNGLGQVSEYTYDGLNRLRTVKMLAVVQAQGAPVDYTETRTYDAVGNILTETDADGVTQTHTYDALSRRRTTTITGPGMPAQGLKTFDAIYDLAGNVLSVTDAHGFTTNFAYDALFRQVETVLPYTHNYGDVPFQQAMIRRRLDLVGNVVYETDANGNPTRSVYNDVYRLTAQILPDGSQITFGYDKVGNRTYNENGQTGLVVAQAYDGLNRTRAITQTVPFGGPGLTQAIYTIGYAYDDADNAVIVTDPRGIKTRTDLDGLDRVVEMVADVDGLALKTTFTFDANGNVKTEKDPQGNDIDRTHTYDGLNRRIRTDYVGTPGDAGAAVFETFAYDARGNIVRHQDRRGVVNKFTYDALDRMLTQTLVETISNGGQELTLSSYQYNDVAQNGIYSMIVTDANGRATTTSYNSMGFVVKIDEPGAGDLIFQYDGINQREARDKKGQFIRTFYDALNRPLRTDEYDASGTLRSTSSTTYDTAARQVIDVDRRGNSAISQQDGLGRVVEVRRTGAGMAGDYGATEVRLESYEFDGAGNVVAYVDARGTRTEMVYDGAGRKTSETLAAGLPEESTVTYTYDAAGNLLTMKDGRNTGAAFDEQHTYDARYRRVSSTNGENETTTYGYDAEDNLVRVTDPRGGITTMRYDELKLLLSVDDSQRAVAGSAAGVTLYAYDANRNRIAQQDANGSLTTYRYDALNRLTDMYQHTQPGTLTPATLRGSDPLGGDLYAAAGGDEATALRWQYGYDANNNQNLVIDARGQRMDVTFDYMNRPVSKVYSGIPAADATLDYQVQAIHATYDANSNPLTVTEVKLRAGAPITETMTFAYDAFDRVQQATRRDYNDPTGRTIEYDYDALGNRTAVIDPDDSATTYTYDALNRLLAVAAPSGTTEFQWWEDNLPKAIVYPNGTWQDLSSGAYDKADRLIKISNGPIGPATPFSVFTYAYDDNGNRTQQVETHLNLNGGQPVTTTYAYDPSDRVTQVNYGGGRVLNYTYDAVGNRLTEQGKDPQTGQDVNRTFVYAALANRPTATYDNVNTLTRIVDNLNAANNVEYEYDANLNQVARIKNGQRSDYRFNVRDHMVMASVGATTTRFDYDAGGMRVKKVGSGGETRYLYDQSAVLVEYDASLATQVKYDYGYALITRHAPGAPAGQQHQYYMLDALGSTANLVGESGTLLQAYRYDAWGRTLEEQGSTGNTRQFTGHYRDSETGLDYFGARYYDPEVGRFISQDPYLGNAGEPPSLHRYLYANANPLRYVDPTGYASVEASSGGLMTALGGAVESNAYGFTGYFSRSYKGGELNQLKGWINDENPHRPGVTAVSEDAMTGAWAGDTARRIQKWAAEKQAALEEWALENPHVGRYVADKAGHLGLDVISGMASTLTFGEGLARGWDDLGRVFEHDSNGLMTGFNGEAVLSAAGNILGDALKAYDLVTLGVGTGKALRSALPNAGAWANKFFRETTLPNISKRVGQRVMPMTVAAPAAETAIQSYSRAKGFEIAIRAADPVTSIVARVSSVLGISRPKPMKMIDGYSKSIWGRIKTSIKGLVYHSDMDLAWVKATRDMVLKNKAGEDVFIKAGEYLTDDLVLKHVVKPLNKVLPKSMKFQHGAQFSALHKYGGSVSWDVYGKKVPHPGPVSVYTGFERQMMSANQVREYAFANLPGRWHPNWDKVTPIDYSTREFMAIWSPFSGVATQLGLRMPKYAVKGHTHHEK